MTSEGIPGSSHHTHLGNLRKVASQVHSCWNPTLPHGDNPCLKDSIHDDFVVEAVQSVDNMRGSLHRHGMPSHILVAACIRNMPFLHIHIFFRTLDNLEPNDKGPRNKCIHQNATHNLDNTPL